MSTPTVFTVTHSCGHDWSHDLSARPPEQRAGLARWLRLTSCPECNRPAHDPDEQQRRDEEVDETTGAWAETAGMPALEGPSHRIREATTVRYRLMQSRLPASCAAGRNGRRAVRGRHRDPRPVGDIGVVVD